MSPKRNVSDCPIFGKSRDLAETVFPTCSDAMKCHLRKRQFIKLTSNKDSSVSEISELIVIKIKDVWIKASILFVFDNRIRKMISDYHSNYINILKSVKGNKDNAKFKEKYSEFISYAYKTLFEISC